MLATKASEIAALGALAFVLGGCTSLPLLAPPTATPTSTNTPTTTPTSTPTQTPTLIPPTSTPRPTSTPTFTPVPPTATRLPLPCGDLPPGMAGLLFINHFSIESTVTIVDHEYHVPGNSQRVMLIPAGKPFTIDAYTPGVGRIRPALGPFTWNAGECVILEPIN